MVPTFLSYAHSPLLRCYLLDPYAWSDDVGTGRMTQAFLHSPSFVCDHARETQRMASFSISLNWLPSGLVYQTLGG